MFWQDCSVLMLVFNLQSANQTNTSKTRKNSLIQKMRETTEGMFTWQKKAGARNEKERQ